MTTTLPEPATLARLHRAFVVALGGYALEFAGGVLVTHERIPVPIFNFVDEVSVAAERQTAFFERALDHYFQRALRPAFRVVPPVADHVDRTLRRFGFRPSPEPRVVLVAERGTGGPEVPADVDVRRAGDAEVAQVAAFWTHDRERDEFLRSLEVATGHPNPGERLVPVLARRSGAPVAAALVFTRGSLAEIHAVSTSPAERGQGVATHVVRRLLNGPESEGATHVAIASTTPRLSRRLAPLGFTEAMRQVEYVLPADARLELPDPGPPTPPRWRPPRSPSRARAGPGRA